MYVLYVSVLFEERNRKKKNKKKNERQTANVCVRFVVVGGIIVGRHC